MEDNNTKYIYFIRIIILFISITSLCLSSFVYFEVKNLRKDMDMSLNEISQSSCGITDVGIIAGELLEILIEASKQKE